MFQAYALQHDNPEDFSIKTPLPVRQRFSKGIGSRRRGFEVLLVPNACYLRSIEVAESSSDLRKASTKPT
jgi:hypothetical protein